MISDPDPDLGMAVQLSSILRLLLDPENMMAASVVNVSIKSIHVLNSQLMIVPSFGRNRKRRNFYPFSTRIA